MTMVNLLAEQNRPTKQTDAFNRMRRRSFFRWLAVIAVARRSELTALPAAKRMWPKVSCARTLIARLVITQIGSSALAKNGSTAEYGNMTKRL